MTKRMKRSVIWLLCGVILLGAALAGCSGKVNNGESTQPPQSQTTQGENKPSDGKWSPEKEVKISVSTWEYETDIQKESWRTFLDAYRKYQPNISVEVIYTPWEQARTWLTMQLTAGTAPEVSQTKTQWAHEDYSKGQIIALNDLMNSKSPYVDTATWGESFLPLVMKQTPNAEGIIASACHTMAAARIFYNIDLFNKAGINEVPADWKSFLEAHKKLADAGIVPFAFANSKPGDNLYNWVERLLTCQVVEHLLPEMDVNKSGMIENNEIARAVDKGIIDLEKSPFKDVFPVIKDWSQYWSKGFNAIDNATAEQMFLRGEAAMFFSQVGTVQKIDDMGATINYGVFTLPYLTKEYSEYAVETPYEMGGIANEGFCIPVTNKGDKMKAAEDFLMYLTSPEVQITRAEIEYRLPSLNVKLNDLLEGWKVTGKTQVLNLYGPVTDQKFFEDSCLYGQIYLTGEITLEEYMKELNASLKDAVDRMKKTNGWSEENNYGIK